MSEKKPKLSKTAFVFLCILVFALFVILPLQIWDFDFHGYYDYAPDGEYHVLVCSSQCYSDNSIFFPIDTCCPTELHGSFRFMQNVTWLSDGWYSVRLRGNVIVDAWLG